MERGRSSGVEHNLAKVGVARSNRVARSSFSLSKIADFVQSSRIRPVALKPIRPADAPLAKRPEPGLLPRAETHARRETTLRYCWLRAASDEGHYGDTSIHIGREQHHADDQEPA